MHHIIGVIGGSSCSQAIQNVAEEVGRYIATRGALLICGGLTGVMEAACRGAKNAGGTTVGVLPGNDIQAANPYVTHPIATGMGYARNYIIIQTAQALIAIDGSYGTLTEIATALNLGKPVIGLDTWELPKAGHVNPELFQVVKSPTEAVELAFQSATR